MLHAGDVLHARFDPFYLGFSYLRNPRRARFGHCANGIATSGMSIGFKVAVIGSDPSVSRWGAKVMAAIGTASEIISMPVVGLGASHGQEAIVGLGLALCGFGSGFAEIAMNIEGGWVETSTRKTFS